MRADRESDFETNRATSLQSSCVNRIRFAVEATKVTILAMFNIFSFKCYHDYHYSGYLDSPIIDFNLIRVIQDKLSVRVIDGRVMSVLSVNA